MVECTFFIHNIFVSFESMYGYLNHIPKPFLLNPWKHHLGYIQDNISALQKLPLADVRRYMLDIGDSVTDIYTEKLSVSGICSEM
ncbi:MAG: hypothetical protein U9Q98_03890 [Bacteroidota bacterium]|nr:hypothetical protein [Bacteroidota bacterium]